MASLNANHIPPALRSLIPIAEEWGIPDDIERYAKLDTADSGELARLVEAVESVDGSELNGWLTGSESYSQEPSDEYIAITCLTMAADAARLRLGRKSK